MDWMDRWPADEWRAALFVMIVGWAVFAATMFVVATMAPTYWPTVLASMFSIGVLLVTYGLTQDPRYDV